MKSSIKGIYLLTIEVKKNIRQRTGKLGEIKFDKGNYIYVGSAQNGIKKRIERHLKKRKKKFWHIDYLLTNRDVAINNIYCKEGTKEEECKTAKELLKHGKPVAKFGCSDCGCKSHLFKINLSETKWFVDGMNSVL
jgi:Uri superfamily endonuclease